MNCYAVLEVKNFATLAEIKTAFRKLAIKYHPDTTALVKEDAQKKFIEIKKAYELLCDPDKRAQHDAILKNPAPVYRRTVIVYQYWNGYASSSYTDSGTSTTSF